MDQARRMRSAKSAKRSEVRLPTLFDRIRELENRAQSKPPPATRPISRYGEALSDLDRIKNASSSEEVLQIVNEVLGILNRSANSEQPGIPVPSAFDSVPELLTAARIHQRCEPETDPNVILRTLLTTAADQLKDVPITTG